MKSGIIFTLHCKNRVLQRIGNNCKENYYKFVGFRIDEFLTWKHQLDYISSKIASAIFALNQVKHIVPIDIRKTIYNTLIKSHIEYGCMILGTADAKNLAKINKLQKRAVRIVSNKKFLAHSDPIFASLKILKLNDLIELNICGFMHKHMNNNLPNSLRNLFTPLTTNNRNKSYRVEKPRISILSNLPTVTFPKVWNSLPLNLKYSNSLSILKNEMKANYYEKYREFKCSKISCYACNSSK